MQPLPTTRSCFVCGSANPAGLRLRFESDGQVVRTRFTSTPAHIGFKDVVHGGILSTLLDEVMAWACGVQAKRFAYCAELSVRFAQPARPGEELVALGRLTQNRRGRVFEAAGEIRNPANVLLATATGKYLPIPEAELRGMMTEFEDNGAAILGTGATGR